MSEIHIIRSNRNTEEDNPLEYWMHSAPIYTEPEDFLIAVRNSKIIGHKIEHIILPEGDYSFANDISTAFGLVTNLAEQDRHIGINIDWAKYDNIYMALERDDPVLFVLDDRRLVCFSGIGDTSSIRFNVGKYKYYKDYCVWEGKYSNGDTIYPRLIGHKITDVKVITHEYAGMFFPEIAKNPDQKQFIEEVRIIFDTGYMLNISSCFDYDVYQVLKPNGDEEFYTEDELKVLGRELLDKDKLNDSRERELLSCIETNDDASTESLSEWNHLNIRITKKILSKLEYNGEIKRSGIFWRIKNSRIKQRNVEKSYSIEIIDNPEYSDFFITPAVYTDPEEGIEYFDDSIGIDGYVATIFLPYFFYKYFDNGLKEYRTYKEHWEETSDFSYYDQDLDMDSKGFNYYGDNFYTYDSMRKMADELRNIAAMLEKGCRDPLPEMIKSKFSILYMTSEDDPDHISRNNAAIPKHMPVIVDFYRRLADKICALMDNNPDTELMIIAGTSSCGDSSNKYLFYREDE